MGKNVGILSRPPRARGASNERAREARGARRRWRDGNRFRRVGWFELTRARGEGGTGRWIRARTGGATEASRAKRRARRARTRERARVGRGGGVENRVSRIALDRANGACVRFFQGAVARARRNDRVFRRDGRWRREVDARRRLRLTDRIARRSSEQWTAGGDQGKVPAARNRVLLRGVVLFKRAV
jgi:hypothetical protein